MIVSIISQGFVWAILGLGIFMTFRILNFPDMTTEGSFPLGGAVAVTLITKGVNPFLATLVAVGAGCLAGMAAGLLYTKGKIPTLLSGILVMTSCHSIMLLIMGRANLGLLGTKQIQDVLPFDSDLNQLLTGLIFVSIVIALMLFFLDTKLGQAYIATGVVGSIAYQFLVWAVIALGFNTSYLRLYSALILAVCLMIPTFKQTILKGAKLSK
ncbi:ABC transporter permease [Streptococcus pneumoniae]|uniref:ABC transporter permease n=1 Tax=Streptococcus pneumoniae TaxID=1313 RepID=UPI0005FD0203|nr:hypothetical protein [Streptococcus pneumoniae]CRD29052.1 ABC transporter%2C membrane-spanning permease [Streptococcus pneumoniae]